MNIHAKLPIRLSAALLAALLASSAFLTACSSGNSGTADTTAQTTANTAPAETTPVEEITRENYPDTLPEMDLQGITVNVNVISDDAYNVDWVAEQKGDIIEDAVYDRNLRIEDRFDVTIETVIDPAPAVARHLLEVMIGQDIVKREGFSITLHASGDDSVLTTLYSRL